MPLTEERIRHDFPDEWRVALAALEALPQGGVCLVAGMPDRGKTTFAVRAAGIVAGEGAKAAFIDAHIPDSQIGFPATVAVAWAASDCDRIQEMAPPAAQFFVGGFSVNQSAFELTVAIVRAIEWAKSSGAACIAVDLPPVSSSASGRRFLAGLIQAVSPNLILGFCEEAEWSDLLGIAAAFCGIAQIIRVGTIEAIVQKSEAQRGLLRRARVYSAFKEAIEMRLSLADRGADTTYTLNTPLGVGEEVQSHLTRWISQTIRADVARAEVTRSKQLNLYVRNGSADLAATVRDSGVIAQHFAMKTVRMIALAELIDSYLGLIDRTGSLVGVGRFAGLQAGTQEMRIMTSLSRGHQIRIVQFGKARISQDGTVRDDA